MPTDQSHVSNIDQRPSRMFTARVLKLTGIRALRIARRPLTDENHEYGTVSMVLCVSAQDAQSLAVARDPAKC